MKTPVESLFTFYFRKSGSEIDFQIGWFWVAVIAALIWWAL